MSDPSLIIERLREAHTRYEIASALDALARCREPFSLVPLVVAMTKDSRWLVRHAALEALGNAVGSGVEEALLAAAALAKDPQDLVYVNGSLGRVGSHRSLPYLTQAVSHPKEDVATSALAALEKIGGPAQQPCFLAALASRRWTIKWYAMCAIDTHGDEVAVDAVLQRAKQILRAGRISKQQGRSELTAAISFLWRHRVLRPDVSEFFQVFLPPRMDRLEAAERTALEGLAKSG